MRAGAGIDRRNQAAAFWPKATLDPRTASRKAARIFCGDTGRLKIFVNAPRY